MASTVVALVFAAPNSVAAQDRPGEARAGGLSAGDYLLMSGGMTVPVNAQGSLQNYKAGPTVSVGYEAWDAGGGSLSLVGVGIAASYSFLPTKSGFADQVAVASGGVNGTGSAKSAKILEITSNARIRIPTPFVMPAVMLGVGFINWAPGPITYQTTGGTSQKVKYQHRSGAELLIGGSVDRHIYDRYGIFAEADYVYGFTSFGQAFTVPNGSCATVACDPLKNTSVAILKGGLRVGLR